MRNSIIIMTITLLLGFAEFASAQQRATLFVIEVTEDDSRVGSTRDKLRFKNEVENLARLADMSLNFKYFDKKDEGLAGYINGLSPGNIDVVWFYYSGHGLNSGPKWPMFAGQLNFKLDSVYDKIKIKNPRLTLVMYDCCNHVTSSSNRVTTRTRTTLPASAAVFLLKKSKGGVMACSSKRGQYSYGDPEIGGYFTDSFFKAMGEVPYNTASEQNMIWNNTAQKAIELTETLSANTPQPQTPVFEIDIVIDEKTVVAPQAAPSNEVAAEDF